MPGLRTRTLLVLIASLGLASASWADDRDFFGIVTRVFDGDSFLVAQPGVRRRIEVRLMDIDAPEKDQPHADVSRSALIKLIENRRVFVDVIEIDRYGRKVARVYRQPDRLDVARSLVRDGHAWVNRKFAKDRSLLPIEDEAKAQRVGLWSLAADDRMPPWEFRRRNRKR